MTYRPLIVLSFFLFACFSVCLPVFGQGKIIDVKVGKEEGPLEIEADELHYEREQRIYYAHGNVEVARGDFNLRADHGWLNTATGELTAWGNVLMSEGEDVLECERLEVNLETRVGKIYKARLFLKDNNYHITGQEAEKLGENRYRVRDGSFTTCDDKRPPWKFTAKELEVTIGGEGVVRGAVFYLEGIPVFYLPWAVVPLKKERETGFLLPEVGLSGDYGPEIKLGFYWAMTREMDSTFFLNYLGDRGFKPGLEYRYALGRETQGEARFFFIDDRVFDGKRYAFFLQNEQKLPYDFYLKSNVNYVSDRTYLRDFDEDLPEGAKIDSRSTRHLRSVLFGGKNWDQFSFLAQGFFFEDLKVLPAPIFPLPKPSPKDRTRLRNDEVLKMLPEVSVYAHPQSLFGNVLFFDVATTYTNFAREEGSAANGLFQATNQALLSGEVMEERSSAHRLDLFPRISYPARVFNVLKLDSNVGFRETYYRSYNDSESRIRGSTSRETIEADVGVSTEFYRVYDGTALRWLSDLFNVTRWMHTIEPAIGYRYIPRVDQDDLPRLDDLDRPVFDRIPYTSEITYGFTQRLVGRPQKERVDSGPYEYAMLRIFQSYSLGDPYEKDGKKRDFSSIRAELSWRFNPYLLVRSNTGIDPYSGRLDEINTLVRVKDRRNDAFQLDYRYSKDRSLISTGDTSNRINTINLHARLKTIDPLYLYGGLRYNFQNQARVENIYGVEYQAQCWTAGVYFEDKQVGVTVEEKNRPLALKREFKVQLYLNLLGLASLGHKPRFMGL